MKRGTEASHTSLKTARSKLQKEKKNAKCKWQLDFALKCRERDMQQNPKEARKMIFKLMQGFLSHHKKSTPKNFINKKGTKAINNSKNLQILSDCYQTIYNNHTEKGPKKS
jgi:hypothetical protein